jgi:GTPase SAR1 family protein
LNITRGKIHTAKKVLIYGPEGIGKSTLASKFPDPVFIDTEGSTKNLDVARFDAPSSWAMLLDEIRYVIDHPEVCKTLVLDTADWAEDLCSKAVCSKYHKDGIEDFGYGKGYTYLEESFGEMLNLLTDVTKRGIHVVVTAHAQMRKFEQPEEAGAYDRWELKLSKKCSPMVKEWADMVLFANYKTIVVKIDGKNKVQGGNRVMYTSHHACWDAKNRFGLPDEIPMDYEAIRLCIEEGIAAGTPAEKPELAKEPESKPEPIPRQEPREHARKAEEQKSPEPKNVLSPDGSSDVDVVPHGEKQEDGQWELPEGVPKALSDLMVANHVTDWEIQNVVGARGYFPADMPIKDYPEDFVDGVLVGAWEQVFGMIKTMRETQEVPFN